jgi:hypothetical protein
LGVPLQIQPIEWRAWQDSKSPYPHQSSIFAPEASMTRRLRQWGRKLAESKMVRTRFSSKQDV